MEARHAEFSGVACRGDDDDAAKPRFDPGRPRRGRDAPRLPAAPAAASDGPARRKARPLGPGRRQPVRGLLDLLDERPRDRPTGRPTSSSSSARRPGLRSGVERFQTTGSTAYGPSGRPRTLYHRVVVQSYCPGPTALRVESQVLPVRSSTSALRLRARPPVVSPAAPPAYTTYVVSWDTLTAGEPGPGGGDKGLHFRLRRRRAHGEVKETLIDTGTAAFADGPGEYLYQLRTENACGEVSAWSKPARVVVGTSKTSALVLVSGAEAFPRAAPRRTPWRPRGSWSGTPAARRSTSRRRARAGRSSLPERVPDRVG